MNNEVVILTKINDLIIFGKRNKQSIDLAQSYVNDLHKTYLKYFEILTKGKPESIKIAVRTFRGNTDDKLFTTESVVHLKNNPNPNLNLTINPDENTSITIGNLSLRNEIFTNLFIPNLAIYPNTINILTNGASGSQSYLIITQKDNKGESKEVIYPLGVFSAGNSEPTKQFLIDAIGKFADDNKGPYPLSQEDQNQYRSLYHIIEGIDLFELNSVTKQLNHQRSQLSTSFDSNLYKSSFPIHPKFS
jgi:hypothetical protein